MYAIEINHLTKSYGSARGIIDISFNVGEGEIFGFIGPNGAGKSTTIRTLLTLMYPTSGNAKIFGKDSVKYTKEIKQLVGYLPSEVFYYDNMKVSDLLKYSASFYKKNCTKRTKELVEMLNVDWNKKISDLSFGNKKKVGIVQALLHEPKLLILDEPTSGLDPLMQQTFFELLNEENRKGTTILFSSHVLSEVQKLCDRVAIIKDGKLVTVESISNLQETTHKKVKIETTEEVPVEIFNFPGVTNLEQKENIFTFLFSGDINEFLKKLANIDVKNIWMEEPDLEEIFMHFYKKETL